MVNSYCVPMGAIDQQPDLNLNITQAEGDYLIDADGKKYLDLRSGLWNVSLGYHDQLYKNIMKDFSTLFERKIPFLDIHAYSHEIYQQYAESLLDFLNKKQPHFSKIFYTNSGSEGTELSIKLCRQSNPDKKTIVSFREGYHGTFFGGMSVSGLDETITQPYEPKLNSFQFLPYPHDDESLHHILMYLDEKGNEIAAFFLEPVIGSAGTLPIPKEYLNKMMAKCKENNILVVFDEVATGFYRTGRRFMFDDLDFVPDLLILSKSINNGILPFGAVAIRAGLSEKLKGHHIEHFSTQNGNLLGVTSARNTLEFYQENESWIMENVNAIESIYTQELNDAAIPFRGTGCMLSIPLKSMEQMFELVQRLKTFGIIVYYYVLPDRECGLTIFPPLTVEKETFRRAMKFTIKSILKSMY
ncbi:aminotransferase class III-fold pyridoxal phosphate-dependent enzyme [Mesobacillus maritimus]|uniref:aminotransferase class III-fold pyridoxal phosphate-dependent enzyme n=1 Tax=Mesobacillus maritimus TaxID=1643336 RepID=UPI00203A395E|nr:aminotransferase class III-fold pyridoxal phosphate-dependent enzyme [Mesobacillus maritimus]MCM3670966.1 aminotransferase class III-fold pyridoxal phosphate-dependent enzyme [Mesobacillus maritimus]